MSFVLATAISLLAATPPITTVAFSPDGAQVLAGSQTGVAIYSWPELIPKNSLPTKLAHVHDLAFAPRGDLLAIAGGSPSESGVVELWDWPAAKLRQTFPAGGDVVYRVAWNAAGSQLAMAGADKRVRLQPVDGQKAKLLEVHSAAVLAALWLPADDRVLSAGVDQAIRLLDSSTGQPVRTFDNHTSAVRDLALRPGTHEGPPLVASAGADRTVRFWQPTIGRLVRFIRLPASPTAIVWHSGGQHVLVSCEDGLLRAIDYETLAITNLAPHLEGWAHAVAASPYGRFALLAGDRGELQKVPLDAINP